MDHQGSAPISCRQAATAAGIGAMLRLDPGFVVVGDPSDGLQVLPFLRDDIVLAALRAGANGLHGLTATRAQCC